MKLFTTTLSEPYRKRYDLDLMYWWFTVQRQVWWLFGLIPVWTTVWEVDDI